MIRGGLILLLLCIFFNVISQHISDFVSLSPKVQDEQLHLSTNHHFQDLIHNYDVVLKGGEFKTGFDFTGYIPINESNTHGYLTISFEAFVGGMGIAEIKLDSLLNKWEVVDSKLVDFESVNGTSRNCSGTITPWNTVVTCEEVVSSDKNNDGYNDLGWCIEIDPMLGKVVDQDLGLSGGDKLWALGNFRHENIVVHFNQRTVYQGADETDGYLYKYVMDSATNLSKGELYVYQGDKTSGGKWLHVNNGTPEECNSVKLQAELLGATKFNGIEDVEISPITGEVFFAVKGEGCVYSFIDEDVIAGDSVKSFKTFVGGMSYEIDGVVEDWSYGNDNLSFDDRGNLWVLQDGGENFVWLVDHTHTQDTPKVRIAMRTPKGSEPTGLTFTRDFKYGFMSIQHPSSLNKKVQLNAFGEEVKMNNEFAFVFSRKEFLNRTGVYLNETFSSERELYPNPSSNELHISNIKKEKWVLFNQLGVALIEGQEDVLLLEVFKSGVYFLVIGEEKYKVIKK